MVRTSTLSSREGIRSERSVSASSKAHPSVSWDTTRPSSSLAGAGISLAARARARSMDMPADVPLDRTRDTSGSWAMKRSALRMARRRNHLKKTKGTAAARIPPAILPIRGLVPRYTSTTAAARASSVVATSQLSPALARRLRTGRLTRSLPTRARSRATGPIRASSPGTPRPWATSAARLALNPRVRVAAPPASTVAVVARRMRPVLLTTPLQSP